MLLTCEACDAPLEADDIDVKRGIARCRYCNAVMRLDELAARNEAHEKDENFTERGPVPLPAGIQVDDWGGALRIVRRWFTPLAFFLLFFCIFWDGFLVVWYSLAFGMNAPLIFKVFPILHVAVGIGLTYFTLALFFNRTVLTVENGLLSVQHGPLPWPGNKTIETSDIDQLYCREKIRHGKNGPQVTYHLNAITTDGRKVDIVSGLDEADQALYLEQRLEEHLRLIDRPVPGELQR